MKKVLIYLAIVGLCSTSSIRNTEISSSPEGRIVGGSSAQPGQFPYQAGIFYNGKLDCGGAIISKRVIITAGHCVGKYSPRNTFVLLGTTSLHLGGVQYGMNMALIHPGFMESHPLRNDLGFIVTDRDIQLAFYVQPIGWATTFDDSVINATVSGWGFLSANLPVAPEQLQFLRVQTIPISDCKSFHGVTDKEICTFNRIGQGLCMGDSGGPLVYEGRLIGIVSWGKPCAVGEPDVFTRVSFFIDLIQEVITRHG